METKTTPTPDIQKTAEAANSLLSWLGLAGMPANNGRSYLPGVLGDLVAAFRDAYAPLADVLTDDCKELLEHGLTALDKPSPRIVISDAARDTLERGCALFEIEANRMLADA